MCFSTECSTSFFCCCEICEHATFRNYVCLLVTFAYARVLALDSLDSAKPNLFHKCQPLRFLRNAWRFYFNHLPPLFQPFQPWSFQPFQQNAWPCCLKEATCEDAPGRGPEDTATGCCTLGIFWLYRVYDIIYIDKYIGINK